MIFLYAHAYNPSDLTPLKLTPTPLPETAEASPSYPASTTSQSSVPPGPNDRTSPRTNGPQTPRFLLHCKTNPIEGNECFEHCDCWDGKIFCFPAGEEWKKKCACLRGNVEGRVLDEGPEEERREMMGWRSLHETERANAVEHPEGAEEHEEGEEVRGVIDYSAFRVASGHQSHSRQYDGIDVFSAMP